MSKISYSLGLVVLGIALLVGAASAGSTASVSGDVKANTATINVLVPSVDFETFAFGDNTKEVSGFINVATNYDVKLQANEADGDGKMSSGANTLTNALKVGTDDFTPVAISSTATTVSDTITAGSSANHAGKFVQTVVPTDTVADDYTITVTFAAVAAS